MSEFRPFKHEPSNRFLDEVTKDFGNQRPFIGRPSSLINKFRSTNEILAITPERHKGLINVNFTEIAPLLCKSLKKASDLILINSLGLFRPFLDAQAKSEKEELDKIRELHRKRFSQQNLTKFQ